MRAQMKLSPQSSQSGINMVDLMMWLVIAALLLATAIQGVGFYQQRAFVDQMSNDAKHAGEVTMTLASQQNGKITEDLLRQAIKDTAVTGEVSLMSKDLGAGHFAIEALHPAITKNRVVFAFGTREKLNPGVNVTKSDSVSTEEFGAIASSCPANDWNAQYYNDTNWSGTALIQRCETTDGLNSNWGYGTPGTGLNAEAFSSIWTKNITVATAGEYRFTLGGDDYVGAYLDGKKILEADYWYGTSKPRQTVYLQLTAGTHNIVIKHNERGGGASIFFDYAPA